MNWDNLNIQLLDDPVNYHATLAMPVMVGSQRYYGVVQQNTIRDGYRTIVFYFLANRPKNDPLGNRLIAIHVPFSIAQKTAA